MPTIIEQPLNDNNLLMIKPFHTDQGRIRECVIGAILGNFVCKYFENLLY